MTSAPFWSSFSPAGTSSTTPEMSDPEMWGRLTLTRGGPILPQMSRRFSAQAFTLIRTSSDPRTGSGASS